LFSARAGFFEKPRTALQAGVGKLNGPPHDGFRSLRIADLSEQHLGHVRSAHLIDFQQVVGEADIPPHLALDCVGGLSQVNDGRSLAKRQDRRMAFKTDHARRPRVNGRRLIRKPVPPANVHAGFHIVRQRIEKEVIHQIELIGHLRTEIHVHVRLPHHPDGGFPHLGVILFRVLFVHRIAPLVIGGAGLIVHNVTRRVAKPRNHADEPFFLQSLLRQAPVPRLIIAQITGKGGVRAEFGVRSPQAGFFEVREGNGIAGQHEVRVRGHGHSLRPGGVGRHPEVPKRFSRGAMPGPGRSPRHHAGARTVQEKIRPVPEGGQFGISGFSPGIQGSLHDAQIRKMTEHHFPGAAIQIAGPEDNLRPGIKSLQGPQQSGRVSDVPDVYRLPRGTQQDERFVGTGFHERENTRPDFDTGAVIPNRNRPVRV
jgi:hypothetical protein